MKPHSPLIVSGSIAIDRIMTFGGRYTEYIDPDQLKSLSISILVDDLHVANGGGGANITYSLALLDESPILLGSAGHDAGDYLRLLSDYGVDVSHVYRSPLATATFNVITDADQNQVGGFFPGAMRDSESLGFGRWKSEEPICVISAHDPDAMRRQVAECERWKLRLMYDVGQQVSNVSAEDLKAGIAAAEVLIVNEYEMSVLAEKTGMGESQIKAAVPVVVTTLGKAGSVIEGSVVNGPIKVGIVKIKEMVDPTGAGDAYRAGFLYGWRRGLDWEVCARLGATCAAYAVETPGTQGHTFTLAEVATRYEETFGEKLEGGSDDSTSED